MTKTFEKKTIAISLATSFVILFGATLNPIQASADEAQVKKDLLEMTGGKRAKVVWLQDTSGGKKYRYFDTKVGKIEDLPIDSESAPLLSADGRYVFVSAGNAPDGRRVIRYDTDTKQAKEFEPGPGNNLLEVWTDPKSGGNWVYVNSTGDAGEPWNQAKGGAINRFPDDKPEQRELFWDRTSSHIYLMISQDGTRACFEPSWANIGQLHIAYGPDGKCDQDKSEYKKFGAGCFPSIAPDNSYRLFRLDGEHKSITMHEANGSGTRQVKVNGMPGVGDSNIWLTRWSRHPRYLTLMGPDSNHARIWMGRFNKDFTEMEKWVQVVPDGDGGKCWQSHSWVEQEGSGGSSSPFSGWERPAKREAKPAPEWPSAKDPVFALRDTQVSTPVVAYDDQGRDLMAFDLQKRGRSLYGNYYELVCDGGSFIARDAGDWIAKQVAKSGAFTLEATVTPKYANEDTEGVILAYANKEGEEVALLQKRNWLFLRLADKKNIGLFKTEAGKTVHLLVAVNGEKGVVYRNGNPVRSGPMPKDTADWAPGELVIGANWSGKTPWYGRIETIAIYPRGLNRSEASEQAAAIKGIYAKRAPAEEIRFKGTLLEQAKTSSLEEIRPYSRSLTAAKYKVDKVIEGEWNNPTITVLHWMIMDGVRLPIADRKPGAKVELTVEALDANPQLESNRRDELMDVDLDAKMFYCESESQ